MLERNFIRGEHPRKAGELARKNWSSGNVRERFSTPNCEWQICGPEWTASSRLQLHYVSARADEHFLDDDPRRQVDAEEDAFGDVLGAHHFLTSGGIGHDRALGEEGCIDVAR